MRGRILASWVFLLAMSSAALAESSALILRGVAGGA